MSRSQGLYHSYSFQMRFIYAPLLAEGTEDSRLHLYKDIDVPPLPITYHLRSHSVWTISSFVWEDLVFTLETQVRTEIIENILQNSYYSNQIKVVQQPAFFNLITGCVCVFACVYMYVRAHAHYSLSKSICNVHMT